MTQPILILLTAILFVFQSWEVWNGLRSGHIGIGRYWPFDKSVAPRAYGAMLTLNVAFWVLLLVLLVGLINETFP